MKEKVIPVFDSTKPGDTGALMGKWSSSSSHTRERPAPSDDPSHKVFSLIEKRYAEPLTLTAIAREVHRSPAHLTTRMRQKTGHSVIGCLITRRMDIAKDLLRTTNLSVAEIGERVGYPEPSVFSRQFRRTLGVSPCHWRLQKRPKDWSFTAGEEAVTFEAR